jgi:hypothetical protein
MTHKPTPATDYIESLEKLIAAAEAEWTCEHYNQELVVFEKSNGARNFYMQCSRCGECVRHLRGSDLHDDDKRLALPRDDEKRRRWYEERRNYLSALYEARTIAIEADRRRNYDQYMKSPEWRERRSQVLQRCKGICEGCGKNHAVQVHHLTYERLGDEMLFDLVAVCLHCHERLHPWKQNK